MNNIIIAFGFMSKVGKDVIAKHLVKKYNFKQIAFGDALKQDIVKIKNTTLDELEENKENYRDLLISHGEEKRIKEPLYWVNLAAKDIDFDDLKQNIVISDVRRIDELKWLKQLNDKYKNVYIIEIVKPKHWDNDIETIKSIVYGNYFNLIYGRIINLGTIDDLHDIIDNILTKIYLTK